MPSTANWHWPCAQCVVRKRLSTHSHLPSIIIPNELIIPISLQMAIPFDLQYTRTQNIMEMDASFNHFPFDNFVLNTQTRVVCDIVFVITIAYWLCSNYFAYIAVIINIFSNILYTVLFKLRNLLKYFAIEQCCIICFFRRNPGDLQIIY